MIILTTKPHLILFIFVHQHQTINVYIYTYKYKLYTLKKVWKVIRGWLRLYFLSWCTNNDYLYSTYDWESWKIEALLMWAFIEGRPKQIFNRCNFFATKISNNFKSKNNFHNFPINSIHIWVNCSYMYFLL